MELSFVYPTLIKTTNIYLTEYYSKNSIRWVPDCPVIMDYKKNGTFAQLVEKLLVVARFDPTIYHKNLPSDLLDSVRNCNLDPANLDICFVAQDLNVIGEREDHQDGSRLTSRIRPHAWLCPNGPCQFSGTIFNRGISLGIFDSNYNLDHEVSSNQMAHFGISIHDSVFSPRNIGIHISNLSTKTLFDYKTDTGQTCTENDKKIKYHDPVDIAFWSLIVDHPTHRSVATLHWLTDFELLFDTVDRGISNLPSFIFHESNDELKIKTFQDMITSIYEINPDLDIVKKLRVLLEHE